MKRFIKWTSNIVFALALVFVAFLLISVMQSKITKGPPTFLGHQLYIVVGGSMSPTFDAGSLAIIDPVTPDTIQVGDVVTFKGVSSETATTHRVVNILNENGELNFVTRGDANDVDDPALLESNRIIGKVVFTIPYIGSLLSFSQSKLGLLTLVIIPGVFLIIFEIFSIYKTIKKMKEEKLSKDHEAVIPSALE